MLSAMNNARLRSMSVPLVCVLLLLGLVLSSCGGVSACIGWWCVGVGPCYPYCYSAKIGSSRFETAYGDFDGDGNLDTASGVAGQTMVILRSGTGGGGFGDPTVFTSASGTSVDFLRTGAFNADAFLDLVVVDVAAGQVRTHLGDGSGAFPTAGVPFTLPSLPAIRRVRVGRVNADAFDDVVLFDFDGGMLVLLSDGAGGFTPAAAGRVAFGIGAVAFGMGLLDGDALVDVAVLDVVAGTLSVYAGNGAGAWALSAGPFALAGVPTAAAVGEFNGQPGLDVAILCGDVPSVRLFFGNGAGGLSASAQGEIPLPFGSATHLRALPAASAPGGPADLVVVGTQLNTGLVGLPNNGDGTFGAAGAPVFTPHVRDLIVTDLNGDAYMDLLLTHSQGSGVGVALGGTRQQ